MLLGKNGLADGGYSNDKDVISYIGEHLNFSEPSKPDNERLNLARSKVISKYRDNPSSPYFSLDLASAVIRQGSFVDKMHKFLWIRSPALTGTITRSMERYAKYFS